MTPEQKISNLFYDIFGTHPGSLTRLPGAGSNRIYFRIVAAENSEVEVPETMIGTYGEDLAENRTFVKLSRHFVEKGISAPRVFGVSPDEVCYIQEDLGDMSLFRFIEKGRTSGAFSEAEASALAQSLELLAKVQHRGAVGLDFGVCYPEPAMNDRMIDWDLSYFKYCFLKPSGVGFSEPLLQDDLDRLKGVISKAAMDACTFMVRDFQSRNVMLREDGTPALIDFQGGRRGPAEYDVASFLWQAKAGIPDETKRILIERYISAVEKGTSDFDASAFRRNLPWFALFRLLQVLGAYGFRGWLEGKGHFLQSIPKGLESVLNLLDGNELKGKFPELTRSLELAVKTPKVRQIIEESGLPGFEGLTVKVFSFSYKKGVPADLSGNGGGFLFDCRAVHNPGRYDEYKQLTGRDAPVKEFLEKDGEILSFLTHCRELVFPSIERYLKRGFNSLSVGFGCTGGQHRSVYSAEAMAKAIKLHYPQVRVNLVHVVQDIREIL